MKRYFSELKEIEVAPIHCVRYFPQLLFINVNVVLRRANLLFVSFPINPIYDELTQQYLKSFETTSVIRFKGFESKVFFVSSQFLFYSQILKTSLDVVDVFGKVVRKLIRIHLLCLLN